MQLFPILHSLVILIAIVCLAAPSRAGVIRVVGSSIELFQRTTAVDSAHQTKGYYVRLIRGAKSVSAQRNRGTD
jgi:hypothetical protein